VDPGEVMVKSGRPNLRKHEMTEVWGHGQPTFLTLDRSEAAEVAVNTRRVTRKRVPQSPPQTYCTVRWGGRPRGHPPCGSRSRRGQIRRRSRLGV